MSEGVHFLVKLQAVRLQLITTNLLAGVFQGIDYTFKHLLLIYHKRAPNLAMHLSMAAYTTLLIPPYSNIYQIEMNI